MHEALLENLEQAKKLTNKVTFWAHGLKIEFEKSDEVSVNLQLSSDVVCAKSDNSNESEDGSMQMNMLIS